MHSLPKFKNLEGRHSELLSQLEVERPGLSLHLHVELPFSKKMQTTGQTSELVLGVFVNSCRVKILSTCFPVYVEATPLPGSNISGSSLQFLFFLAILEAPAATLHKTCEGHSSEKSRLLPNFGGVCDSLCQLPCVK